MENELQPRHHPDMRWAIIISVAVTAIMVVIVAYAWNNMKKLELEATYNRTTSDVATVNQAKINTMQEEINGLRDIITNLKIEIGNYQKDLAEAKKVATLPVPATTTAEILPKK